MMRVMFAGGGTGGHIYPALALARYLREERKAEVIFVGTERGMEKEIVPAGGFPIKYIPVVGLERKISLRAGQALFLAAAGLLDARRLIKEFRPDVVVGTGGYVAGPVVLAAKLSGVPAVIHEQNAIPGLTNKLLARLAAKVCLSVPESVRYFPSPGKTIVTGNPRATEALRLTEEPQLPRELAGGTPLLLCVGGSHGAARLNEAFTAALPEVLEKCHVQIVYISGKRYFDEISKNLASLMIRYKRRLQLLEYHAALPALMKRASLIVSRAGATTLAEITALGVPAVLVPSPNVTNNHQEHNARALADHGAAFVLLESELGHDRLGETLIGLLSDAARLAKMAESCRRLGVPDAAERMAKVIYSVMKQRI